MAIKNQDDYFEFHESPEDLWDDPADYQEAIGNTFEARRIRKRRKAVEDGDIECPHSDTVCINEEGNAGIFCVRCGEKLGNEDEQRG